MEISIDEALSIRDNFAKYKSVSSVLIQGKSLGTQPKYSIVIPTYRRVSTLKDTLESAVNQDFNGGYDIIVCDNDPERNDETEKFILSFEDDRLLYYKNTMNIGMTGNWNRCIELCDGEYVVMIHDDDILLPNFLSQSDKVIREVKSVKILYPERVNWYQSESPTYPIPRVRKEARLYKMHLLDFFFQGTAPTGILMNKEEVIRLGGFYEGAYPAADLYFNIKAINNSAIYKYTMPLSVYRWGINESFKRETLLNFISVYNPLRIKMGEMIGLPRSFVNYANQNYCRQVYDVIEEKLPDESMSLDRNQWSLSQNKLERFMNHFLTQAISFFLALKHRFESKKIDVCD